MKISTKSVSSYLAQDDVKQPIVATMDCVTVVPALRNPNVLHFQGNSPKPIPLNLTNRRELVALFGDEDSNWVGKQVEIYIDPNVQNSKGERTGGIRLRAPIVRAAAPAPAAKPVRTLEENLRWGLDALDAAKSEDRLDVVAVALGRLTLNAVQASLVQRRYEKNLQRLTGTAPAPATAPAPSANGAATAK